MNEIPKCDIERHDMNGYAPDAVAKVKRLYDSGPFHVFYVCKQCLRDVQHDSARFSFTIEVEEFNRRATDRLRRTA
jgi:hypothetical protein